MVLHIRVHIVVFYRLVRNVVVCNIVNLRFMQGVKAYQRMGEMSPCGVRNDDLIPDVCPRKPDQLSKVRFQSLHPPIYNVEDSRTAPCPS